MGAMRTGREGGGPNARSADFPNTTLKDLGITAFIVLRATPLSPKVEHTLSFLSLFYPVWGRPYRTLNPFFSLREARRLVVTSDRDDRVRSVVSGSGCVNECPLSRR